MTALDGIADGSDIPLSILIRTLNEADRIGEAIRAALPLRGEILVIDANSTDRTVEIARSLGARVIQNAWPGFGPQRRFGEEHCSHDLIFCLDADEIVTPEFVREVRALFTRSTLPKLAIVRKAMVFPHWDRPPPFGFCTRQIYLYDRRFARTTDNPNWDQLDITTDERPHLIRAPILHHSFRDWDHAVRKANYVAQLAADTEVPRPLWTLLLRLPFEFPITFLKFYFGRRYFLGGADGLIMATIGAFGRFIKIAKYIEKYRMKGR